MASNIEVTKNSIEEVVTLGTPSRKIIQSIKAKADKKRTTSEVIADWMTQKLGSITFLTINALFFIAWILINSGIFPGLTPIDPFPFTLLTMVVSLEAIFLAIIVLMSQNRAARIDDLREEIDLKVDIITEQELTKLLKLTVMQMVKNGFDLSQDKVLKHMTQPTDMRKIEKVLENEIV